jgi:hypothetical protein
MLAGDGFRSAVGFRHFTAFQDLVGFVFPRHEIS